MSVKATLNITGVAAASNTGANSGNHATAAATAVSVPLPTFPTLDGSLQELNMAHRVTCVSGEQFPYDQRLMENFLKLAHYIDDFITPVQVRGYLDSGNLALLVALHNSLRLLSLSLKTSQPSTPLVTQKIAEDIVEGIRTKINNVVLMIAALADSSGKLPDPNHLPTLDLSPTGKFAAFMTSLRNPAAQSELEERTKDDFGAHVYGEEFSRTVALNDQLSKLTIEHRAMCVCPLTLPYKKEEMDKFLEVACYIRDYINVLELREYATPGDIAILSALNRNLLLLSDSLQASDPLIPKAVLDIKKLIESKISHALFMGVGLAFGLGSFLPQTEQPGSSGMKEMIARFPALAAVFSKGLNKQVVSSNSRPAKPALVASNAGASTAASAPLASRYVLAHDYTAPGAAAGLIATLSASLNPKS